MIGGGVNDRRESDWSVWRTGEGVWNEDSRGIMEVVLKKGEKEKGKIKERKSERKRIKE